MYILIFILPFTSFCILSCFSYFLKKKELLYLSLICICGAFCCSLLAIFEVFIGLSICVITIGYFFDLTFLSCPFTLLYDELCVLMCFIVLIISLMVHYYSIEYMNSDPFLLRFISYLSLFTFFMLFLVTSGTILQLFIGWEGVGLSSYLLINFWFTRVQATKSALKAVVLNRFGDIGLYGVLIILIMWFKCFDFLSLSLLFNYDFYYENVFQEDFVFFWNKLHNISMEQLEQSCTLFHKYKLFIMSTENFINFEVTESLLKTSSQQKIVYELDERLRWLLTQYDFNELEYIINHWTVDLANFNEDIGSYSLDAFWDNFELYWNVLSQNWNLYIKNIIIIPYWIYELLGFCILLAAIGKSAQIGLHTWLPDAMEGPTPVSALIHAATMVTAGVFILIRFFFILENLSLILIWITLVGAITVFFAGSIGSFQYDLKKVIAYSTCSQLGYMVFACGMNDFNISLFHLINHAFFKALLFLGAGAVIHSIYDEQDMRKMGGLFKYIPLTYVSICFSSLALIGIPYLSGFYSKDILLENSFINLRLDIFIGYILCVVGIIFTTIYSIRLLYLVFFNGININKSNVQIFESGLNITLILSILTVLSIAGGFFIKEWIILSYSISNLWVVDNVISSEFLFLLIKLIPFSFIFLSIFLSCVCWVIWKPPIILYHFFNQKWFFDLIYNNFIVWIFINFSYFITFKLIDRAILEQWGSFGLSNLTNYSIKLQNIHTGYIYHYIFIVWNFCIWILFCLNLQNFLLDYFYLIIYVYISCILTEDMNMYEWPGPRHIYYYE